MLPILVSQFHYLNIRWLVEDDRHVDAMPEWRIPFADGGKGESVLIYTTKVF
ncbi:hypothetical protein [Parabacteroides gordonii]|uniref:hypothetical protein n=1 Tax=Parabacteroides gordonii TaxID=574930 RepID=UPI00241D3938|nr:hypothetical protein [Parabacteroides gordonii]